MAPDSSTAATASADFTAGVWDTHTGELLFTLQHNHIVRAVAYAPDNPDLLATGGFEKKLRIFDLSEMRPRLEAAVGGGGGPQAATVNGAPQPGLVNGAPAINGTGAHVSNGTASGASAATPASFNATATPTLPVTIPASAGFEIGAGAHTTSIKFIVWTRDPNVLITASDATLRWFDLPSRSVIKSETLDGEIRSCELVSLGPENNNATDSGAPAPARDIIGDGLPVLAVAAGKEVAFWGGLQASEELKRMKLGYGVASVGLDLRGRKLVVGEEPGTWARVLDWDDGSELGEWAPRRLRRDVPPDVVR